MVVLTKPALPPEKPLIPAIDLRAPGADALLVRACEELGFFKVTNHGIPMELIARLESAAVDFFARPQAEKDRAAGAVTYPFGYGSRCIGRNGDVGWVEYLLMEITSDPAAFLAEDMPFRRALEEYAAAVRGLACEVLEVMAEGLGIAPRDVLSGMVRGEGSDSALRVNHYPLWSMATGTAAATGFGEHTDPQIISVLRSNDTAGLEISLRDGSWVAVLPDRDSFFVNVGDALQVLTNGRFRSVRHRVLANGFKSRVSMIYFAGPGHGQRLAPLTPLMADGEESLYREFTWCEFKACVYANMLAHNRLDLFHNEANSKSKSNHTSDD